jgi:REP element-mobilizing transposase RayT
MNTHAQAITGQRALRKPRISVPGQIYFVTTVTRSRERFFEITEAARAVARTFADTCIWQKSELLAWVVMPDHVHMLLRLGAEESLCELIQRIKSFAARATNSAISRSGQVWQPGYYDHALRDDEDVVSTARYLVANPIRAGLVTNIGEFPYWDAIWLTRNDNPLGP